VLEKAVRGSWRMRQRPGPANPLGRIKFVIPNSASIYLHDTPSTRLFHLARRDFSHGCIRVQDPFGLARFILMAQPEWNEESILAAMQSGKSFAVRVSHPVPVTVAYATAIVNADGSNDFYQDIYGNDQLLDTALRALEQSRRAEAVRLNRWPVK
jgi:murein L,D-transpeptidase YcbB/YkuD